jgi:hypothetical protein
METSLPILKVTLTIFSFLNGGSTDIFGSVRFGRFRGGTYYLFEDDVEDLEKEDEV